MADRKKAPARVKWPADKVVRRKVDDLIPYARNARTHSDEQVAQIAASIVEWGWTTAVLLDEQSNIIAGHGRVLAARKLGLDSVPTMVASGWSDAQKKAYILADNQLALNAGWDNDLLRLELQNLDELDFNIDLIGFDVNDLASLFDGDHEGPPEDFDEKDEDIETEHECPKCGYRFSGGSKVEAGSDDGQAEAEA